MARFKFYAFGHERILSTHPTTIEITRSQNLTIRGDCVIGVKSSNGLRDFPDEIKRLLCDVSGRGRLEIRVSDEVVIIEGRGAKGLSFLDLSEIVLRKSGFVSDRTLMVYSDKAARDIPRRMVKLLMDPGEKISFELSAWSV
jgi:hypothetical protein